MADAQKVGIEHLKAVLDLALAGVEAGVGIVKEGKFDAAVVTALVPVVLAVPPAISALGSVPAEISGLDQAEAAELVTYVMSKLAIDDVKAQKVIAASLQVVVSGVGLVKAIQS